MCLSIVYAPKSDKQVTFDALKVSYRDSRSRISTWTIQHSSAATATHQWLELKKIAMDLDVKSLIPAAQLIRKPCRCSPNYKSGGFIPWTTTTDSGQIVYAFAVTKRLDFRIPHPRVTGSRRELAITRLVNTIDLLRPDVIHCYSTFQQYVFRILP